MAHKVWTGSISFGLVSIPVGLYSATESHTIHFNQYQRGTSDRVRYRRFNERTGAELDYDDIVKGREVGGNLVTVEQDELDAIAPGRSHTIEIVTFVDLAEIDPVYFQKTYWLAPTDEQHDRPYHLLRRALDRTDRVGIARFVLRGKEYLTAIRAEDTALALDTLFFSDEVRDPAEVVDPRSARQSLSGQELRMATDLIESMSGDWQPRDYADTYTARVEKLLEDKSRGRTPEPEATPPEPTDIVDLADALRRSTDQARHGETTGDRETSDTAAEAEAETRTPRQRSASTPQDPSQLSKSELARRARELQIKGRSKLSRKDLEKAILESAGTRSGRGRRSRKAS
ncbi:DNA end-binding protein Ku [Halopolyspora algeriensis]|uniref:Non-homologous end joining protein Ku n=1 Tax=Halopolyspora algeriensis TaxID=1500506 RepID=A0A368VXW5_9ACTN|nr:Ku protein [Halopolyspora algeriensis]RCW46157.1 DNA end-binding protein Ku [Halopolyspora algeriensis]TQM55560.1 DNA end-binding protein Ku [Halopolyspora algeriensis]